MPENYIFWPYYLFLFLFIAFSINPVLITRPHRLGYPHHTITVPHSAVEILKNTQGYA